MESEAPDGQVARARLGLLRTLRLIAAACRAEGASLLFVDEAVLPLVVGRSTRPPQAIVGEVLSAAVAGSPAVVWRLDDAGRDERFAAEEHRALAAVAVGDDERGAMGVLVISDAAAGVRDDKSLEALRLGAEELSAQLARLDELQRLSQAESRLEMRSLALEHSLNGFDVVNDRGLFVYANPAYLRMWGYDTIDEVLGKSPLDHCADPDVARHILQTLQTQGEMTVEFVARRKDGSTFDALMAARAFRHANGRIYHLGSSLDVSEQKKAAAQLHEAQELLRQSQKMEAIGQLSGGVAHDINNILTAVRFHVAVLANQPLSTQGRESVEELSLCADRAAGLTRQLLQFSRRQPRQLRDLEVGKLTVGLGRLLSRVVGETVRIEIERPSAPLWIHADSGMIEQVLLNLVVNAKDAMPRGGRVDISCERVTFDDDSARGVGGATPGEYVRVSVKDEGTGMSLEQQRRIFEPFFTTKEVGKGTGLGLSTVFGIVHQHRGFVVVDSAPGQGSTFHVHLPAVPQPASATPTPRPGLGGDSAPGLGETVLFVEDETSLRHLLRRLLSRLGYQLLEADSAPAALALVDKHEGPIHVLLTDMVMPGGSGYELAQTLRARLPELRVIYMSGYSPELEQQDIELLPGVNFLAKPFSPTALAEALQQTLARRGT